MKEERIIYRIVHGSTMYGTNTPTSDVDYKEVYVPSGRSILLGAIKEGRASGPEKAPSEKNKPGDIDTQSFAVNKLFKMVAGGDIIGCELIFTPPGCVLLKDPDYDLILENKRIFLSKKVDGYVGYCRQQANKYGIRGSRIAAVRGLLEVLTGFDNEKEKLSYAWPDVVRYVEGAEHCSILDIENGGGFGKSMPHLECCDRKVPITNTIGDAIRIYKRVFDEYGHRALAAEKNEGIDWKALSHAVRVGNQAIELLNDHTITFPRPEAPVLLSIKRGEVPYKAVAETLDELLTSVVEASERSTLPAKPDEAAINEMIVHFHREAVTG